jgi:hypothetical protein
VHGHNEDWWSTVADKMSIFRTPDWTGYIYPGQLPGTSFLVNKNGLSMSMNSMYPSTPGYFASSLPGNAGVAFVFAYVLRAVVNATSTDAVVDQLARFPIYSGYSINVVSSCETSIANVEGYGDRLGVRRRSSAAQAGSSIGHYNSYINLNVPDEQGGVSSTSTQRRQCEQASTFAGTGDVRAFLGNLSCPVFFTDTNGSHESETLATWIADPAAGQCRLYRLPAACNPAISRCVQEEGAASNPQVLQWEITCPPAQNQ